MFLVSHFEMAVNRDAFRSRTPSADSNGNGRWPIISSRGWVPSPMRVRSGSRSNSSRRFGIDVLDELEADPAPAAVVARPSARVSREGGAVEGFLPIEEDRMNATTIPVSDHGRGGPASPARAEGTANFETMIGWTRKQRPQPATPSSSGPRHRSSARHSWRITVFIEAHCTWDKKDPAKHPRRVGLGELEGRGDPTGGVQALHLVLHLPTGCRRCDGPVLQYRRALRLTREDRREQLPCPSEITSAPFEPTPTVDLLPRCLGGGPRAGSTCCSRRGISPSRFARSSPRSISPHFTRAMSRATKGSIPAAPDCYRYDGPRHGHGRGTHLPSGRRTATRRLRRICQSLEQGSPRRARGVRLRSAPACLPRGRRTRRWWTS